MLVFQEIFLNNGSLELTGTLFRRLSEYINKNMRLYEIFSNENEEKNLGGF